MPDYVSMARQLGIRGSVKGSQFIAACPLHHDQHPSFTMQVHSGLFICYKGCAQGDFHELVERVLNCTPGEARTWALSNSSANNLENTAMQTAFKLGTMQDLPQLSTDNLAWKLHYQSLNSTLMPQWFIDRGFSWQTINHWDIRYDQVQDAVVLPVHWHEEFIGTITRNTSPGLPKYYNSDFKKSEILFGEISESVNSIIICEGPLDALWLWQNGYNSASVLGSGISNKQVDILRRRGFGEIILALDNDETGNKGTKEAIRLLTKAGWLLPQIKIIRFPKDIKDPQDCNPETLNKLFEQRERVIQWSHL